MGLALHRREALRGLKIADEEIDPREEHRRASLAYLVWLLAIIERIAPSDEASSWYRLQMAQALRFGNAAALAALAALIWPLLATYIVQDLGAALWIYGAAFVLDAVLLVVWAALAVRYSRLAARGTYFELTRLGLPKGSRGSKR